MKKIKLPVACNIITGKLDANAAESDGIYPFFTCGEKPEKINTYAFDDDVIILAGNNAQGNFHIQRYTGKFNAYQRTYVITAKEGFDIDYIKYSIELSLNHLKKMAQGSQTKFLTMSILNEFEINELSLNEQRNLIASIVAIDKKIENNNTINNNLQQLATTLYDFLFAKKQPNGKLSDILLENEKSTIQVGSSDNICGNYPFFTSGETINEWQDYFVDGINCYLSTGGNASIKVYAGKAAYSTDTWCIYGKENYSSYLYFYLKSIIKSINSSYFAGSGLKHLQKDALLDIDLYIPTKDEIETFNKIANPILIQASQLFTESKKLIKQRDFLLPLLMNGQATIDE